MSAVLLPLADDGRLATALATRLGARVGTLRWTRFPDAESLIAIDPSLDGADVVLVASLNRPDDKALALRFAADTARELGARSVGLVAPYLAYMRQDRRFHPGEAVSARAFARFLDESVDWLVTVDPHLHRIKALGRVFRIPADCVSAAAPIAGWIRDHVEQPLLIGPDEESAQWVERMASAAGASYELLRKVRHGPTDVEVSLPDVRRLRGRTPVLVDDIVSTGKTMCAVLEHLHGRCEPAICVVIHPLFVGDAFESLYRAGAGLVVSTDSIPHSSNAIRLDEPIAAAVAARLAATSIEIGP